jgi:hypothetical protein
VAEVQRIVRDFDDAIAAGFRAANDRRDLLEGVNVDNRAVCAFADSVHRQTVYSPAGGVWIGCRVIVGKPSHGWSRRRSPQSMPMGLAG